MLYILGIYHMSGSVLGTILNLNLFSELEKQAKGNDGIKELKFTHRNLGFARQSIVNQAVIDLTLFN